MAGNMTRLLLLVFAVHLTLVICGIADIPGSALYTFAQSPMNWNLTSLVGFLGDLTLLVGAGAVIVGTFFVRSDILIFTTPELIQDVCLKGKPIVHLFVSSDRLDTDFAIRLTDLYPDGSSMLLAETIKRMRFRNGYTENDTCSMIPGQIYEIEIELKNMANTFLTGHKIRIALTSSNYPRFDNNLNNGQEMYVAGDTLIATNIVYHNSNYSSYVEFPFVDYAQSDKIINTKNPVLSIYPNPCNDILYLHTALSGVYKITIYDIYGKTYYMKNVLNKSKLNNKILIDLSDFSKGIYFIEINENKNNVSVKKLMRY